uniref:STAS domain-containing protein n=1 Tax=Calothrix rhizosoleniae TaxID=888997 RepID=UPI001177F502
MTFQAIRENTDTNIAKITLSGELNAATAPTFKQEVENAAATDIQKLVLIMKDLEYMSSL